MTRLEIHIDELVLHGVPPEYSEALPRMIERRLAELAGGPDQDPVAGAVPGRHGPARVEGMGPLADAVARQVWAQARPSGWHGGPARPGGAP